LGRQLDAGDSGAGIEQAERCFEAGADRRSAIGERDAAVDVVGCKSGAGAELEGAGRTVLSWRGSDRSVAGKPGAGADIDRASRGIVPCLRARRAPDLRRKRKRNGSGERGDAPACVSELSYGIPRKCRFPNPV